ncbi:hypothetical protein BsWGS_18735 [Bradybaena similaris]
MIRITVIYFLAASVAMSSVFAFLLDTPHQALKVAAFNIQTFGQTKISNSTVVNNICKILQRYDIVLLQEVRDSSDAVLKTLQTHLNVSDSWAFAASPRLGRSTTYKEQYAFFYRTKSVNITSQYLYNDTVHDYFEREPFSAEIRYYSVAKSAFRHVVLLGLHTRPEDAFNELRNLSAVMKVVAAHFNHHADAVIGMGDFNADCSYVSGAQRRSLEIFTPSSGFSSYINDSADTTVAHSTNCAYDRVISLGSVDLRHAQPYNFELGLNLSTAAASAVSDHYPVEFALH